METLFENKHIRTAQCIREMYTSMFLKRPIMYVMYAVMAVVLVAELILLICFQNFNFMPFFILICAPIVLWYLLTDMIKRVVRQNSEMSGGQPFELTTVVTADKIRSVSRIGENELEWCKIKKAELTKNYILLRTQANMVFVLAKDGFTKGTCEEFCEFLRGKGLLQ